MVHRRGHLWRLGAAVVAIVACSLLAVRGAGSVHAAGITVTYPAGWNLVGGPDGTVFNASGNSYTLGAGDTAYAANPGSAPIAGGKGYWMYFPSQTTVTLNGAGLSSVRVSAPAGQYVMIGDPSGTQTATVDGADQVLTYDAAAGMYSATTQLAIGQGAWALSNAGGSITITATGPAQPLPADTTALPAPAPQPSSTPEHSTAGSEEPGPCTLGPLCNALAIDLKVDPDQTTVNHDTPGDLIVYATVYSAGQKITADARVRVCVNVFGQTACARTYRLLTGATLALDLSDVPPVPVGTVIKVHADAAYQGLTASADITYTVVK